MLLALLLACGGDIGIRTVDKIQTTETAEQIIDTASPEPSFEPSSEPAVEPATEPSTEPLEGTVGLTRYTLEQLACPACMGTSQEITVLFEAKFHDKINNEHPLWFPPMGQCSTNTNPIGINVSPINVGQSLSIQGSTNSFSAYGNSTGLYSSYIQEWQYDRNALTTVRLQDNTSYSFTSIEGFDDIQPWEIRYVDPSYAFAAIVSKAHEAGVLEQEQMRTELKRDVGRLIIDTTTKVTGKVLTDNDQKTINEETASQVSL